MLSELSAKIGIGVVGAGFGATVHVPAFRANPDCEVVAICASTQERARAAANRLNIPKAYESWMDLVDDPNVHAITVALPPALQPEVVLAAAARRKPVFCEKPLALNYTYAKAMTDAIENAGLPGMVNLEFLEIPSWAMAAQWMAERRLGDLRHVVVNWQIETFAHRTGTPSWKTSSDGGSLNLFAAHTFHYIEQLAAPIKRLSAHLHTPVGLSGEGDANVCISAELNGGALAAMVIGGASLFGGGHRVECFGADGAWVLENVTRDHVRGFVLRTARRGDVGFVTGVPLGDSSEVNPNEDGRIRPVSRLATRFLDAIRKGLPCHPNLRAGLRVQALLDAARLSHRSRTWVETPIDG